MDEKNVNPQQPALYQPSPGIDCRCCDCGELPLEPGSVKAIVTDLPYCGEWLPNVAAFSEWCAKVLAPGGVLVAFYGHHHLRTLHDRTRQAPGLPVAARLAAGGNPAVSWAAVPEPSSVGSRVQQGQVAGEAAGDGRPDSHWATEADARPPQVLGTDAVSRRVVLVGKRPHLRPVRPYVRDRRGVLANRKAIQRC